MGRTVQETIVAINDVSSAGNANRNARNHAELRARTRRRPAAPHRPRPSPRGAARHQQTAFFVGKPGFIGQRIRDDGSSLLWRAFAAQGSPHADDDDRQQSAAKRAQRWRLAQRKTRWLPRYRCRCRWRAEPKSSAQRPSAIPRPAEWRHAVLDWPPRRTQQCARSRPRPVLRHPQQRRQRGRAAPGQMRSPPRRPEI